MYTLNSEKQWRNKVTGEKLPECEAGRKPRALGSRLGMGVEGPVLRQASWWECPRVTSLLCGFYGACESQDEGPGRTTMARERIEQLGEDAPVKFTMDLVLWGLQGPD